MKRGVGIKYQCEFLEPQKLNEWLFDNVGKSGTRAADESLVCANEEKGWYFTYNHIAKVLRIALWTERGDAESWPEIQTLAERVSKECRCNLTTWAVDLHEWNEAKQGHECIYDALVAGEVIRHMTQPTMMECPKAEKNPGRWN